MEVGVHTERNSQFYFIMGHKRKNYKIYGFGVNDYGDVIRKDGETKHFYFVWRNMIRRCYSNNAEKTFPTYIGCKVCDEWRSLTKFKEWFDAHYVEGWQIDKDLLSNGQKIYSPETCCFLPNQINTEIIPKYKRTSQLPTGVYRNRIDGCYGSRFKIDGNYIYLGTYKTVEDAWRPCKIMKEAYIKTLACRYKNRLEERAYNALMEFEFK